MDLDVGVGDDDDGELHNDVAPSPWAPLVLGPVVQWCEALCFLSAIPPLLNNPLNPL